MLETDVIPGYAPADVQFVAIHSYPEGEFAAGHVQQFGLTFPVALDLDGELFRRFRLPNHVFPLNVVIDAAGNVAHVGTDLDETLAAVDQLLGQ